MSGDSGVSLECSTYCFASSINCFNVRLAELSFVVAYAFSALEISFDNAVVSIRR